MIFERNPNTRTHMHTPMLCFSSDILLHLLSSSFLSQVLNWRISKAVGVGIHTCYFSLALPMHVCVCVSPFVFRFRHLRTAKLSERNHCFSFFSQTFLHALEQCIWECDGKEGENTHNLNSNQQDFIIYNMQSHHFRVHCVLVSW